jgi:hypothetical protein
MSAEEWFGLAIPVTVVTPDLFANSNGFTLKVLVPQCENTTTISLVTITH